MSSRVTHCLGHHALEHEAVGLRLGQGIGALLLDGVLRRHHQEGARQGIGLVAEGDLALLHGLEEGGLHLGGGAVDFVGDEQVCEDGALVRGEGSLALVVNQTADHVRRQQVRREGDALGLQSQRGGEGAHGGGLGQTRHAFEQDVPARHQCNQQGIEHVLLPHQRLVHFASDRRQERRATRNRLIGLCHDSPFVQRHHYTSIPRTLSACDTVRGGFHENTKGTQGPGHFTVRPFGPLYRAHPLCFYHFVGNAPGARACALPRPTFPAPKRLVKDGLSVKTMGGRERSAGVSPAKRPALAHLASRAPASSREDGACRFPRRVLP